MRPQEVTALVRAAGSGVRLGMGPKARVRIGGVPLIDLALRPLSPGVGHVVVAVSADDLGWAQDRLASSRVRVIVGGSTRWETTTRLAATAESSWVMLHDTVHPMVSQRIVADLLVAAEESGAAVPAWPMEDFTWDVKERRILTPRQLLVIQTPVVLPRETLLAATDLIAGRPDHDPSEPSIIELLTALGCPWTFVRGDPRNLKVTHPGDLDVVQALINSEAQRSGTPDDTLAE